MVNGQHVGASATRWSAYEAGRRSAPIQVVDAETKEDVSVQITTATRMPFEQNGVQWVINITNPSKRGTATIRVDIELSASVRKSPLATKNLLEVTDGLRRPP